MSDYYCSRCGADLEDQLGFDPNASYWFCTECGQLLIDSNISDSNSRYDGVGWFCDGCGAFLNKQRGFSDWNNIWACTECGYINNISEDEIYDSEDDYRSSQIESNLSDRTNAGSSAYTAVKGEDLDDDKEDESDTCSYYNSDNGGHKDDCFNSKKYRKKMGTIAFQKRKEGQYTPGREQRKKSRQKIRRILTGKKQNTGISSDQCKGMNYIELVHILEKQEFYNISAYAIEDLSIEDVSREGTVETIAFNGIKMFDANTKFSYTSKIEIIYHMLRRRNPPLTSKEARKRDVDDVVWEFSNAGFVNIEKIAISNLKRGWFVKEDSVETVIIDGKTDFKRAERIRIDAHIAVTYYTFNGKRR